MSKDKTIKILEDDTAVGAKSDVVDDTETAKAETAVPLALGEPPSRRSRSAAARKPEAALSRSALARR